MRHQAAFVVWLLLIWMVLVVVVIVHPVPASAWYGGGRRGGGGGGGGNGSRTAILTAAGIFGFGGGGGGDKNEGTKCGGAGGGDGTPQQQQQQQQYPSPSQNEEESQEEGQGQQPAAPPSYNPWSPPPPPPPGGTTKRRGTSVLHPLEMPPHQHHLYRPHHVYPPPSYSSHPGLYPPISITTTSTPRELELQNQLDNATMTVTEMQQREARHVRQLEVLTERILQVEAQAAQERVLVEAYQDNCSALELQVSQSQEQVEHYKALFIQEQNHSATLQGKYQKLKKQLKKTRRDLESLAMRIEKHRVLDQRNSQQDTAKMMMAKNQKKKKQSWFTRLLGWSSSNFQVHKDNNELKNDLVQLQKQAKTKLLTALKTERQNVDDLEVMVATLRKNTSHLIHKLRHKQLANDKLEAMVNASHEESIVLKAAIKQLQKELAQQGVILQFQVQQLETALVNMTLLQQQRTNLTAAHEMAMAQQDKIIQEKNAALNQSQSNLTELQHYVDQLEERLAQFRLDKRRLEEQHVVESSTLLLQQENITQHWQTKCRQLQAHVEQQAQEQEEFKSVFQQVVNDRQLLQSQIAHLKQEQNQAHNQIQQLQQSLDTLQQQKQQQQREEQRPPPPPPPLPPPELLARLRDYERRLNAWEQQGQIWQDGAVKANATIADLQVRLIEMSAAKDELHTLLERSHAAQVTLEDQLEQAARDQQVAEIRLQQIQQEAPAQQQLQEQQLQAALEEAILQERHELAQQLAHERMLHQTKLDEQQQAWQSHLAMELEAYQEKLRALEQAYQEQLLEFKMQLERRDASADAAEQEGRLPEEEGKEGQRPGLLLNEQPEEEEEEEEASQATIIETDDITKVTMNESTTKDVVKDDDGEQDNIDDEDAKADTEVSMEEEAPTSQDNATAISEDDNRNKKSSADYVHAKEVEVATNTIATEGNDDDNDNDKDATQKPPAPLQQDASENVDSAIVGEDEPMPSSLNNFIAVPEHGNTKTKSETFDQEKEVETTIAYTTEGGGDDDKDATREPPAPLQQYASENNESATVESHDEDGVKNVDSIHESSSPPSAQTLFHHHQPETLSPPMFPTASATLEIITNNVESTEKVAPVMNVTGASTLVNADSSNATKSLVNVSAAEGIMPSLPVIKEEENIASKNGVGLLEKPRLLGNGTYHSAQALGKRPLPPTKTSMIRTLRKAFAKATGFHGFFSQKYKKPRRRPDKPTTSRPPPAFVSKPNQPVTITTNNTGATATSNNNNNTLISPQRTAARIPQGPRDPPGILPPPEARRRGGPPPPWAKDVRPRPPGFPQRQQPGPNMPPLPPRKP